MKSWLRNKFNYVKHLFSKREEATCKNSLQVSLTKKPKYGNSAESTNVQKTSEAGVKLICDFEGYYPYPYLCPAGVPTIGFGTTIYKNGEGVKLSDSPISEKTAREYLAHDLKAEESNLNEFISTHNLELNNNQFSALISFAYNLGFGSISKRSSTVYKGLTQRNNEKVCYGMGLYVKANGRVLKGLERRRKAEIRLYKTV